jgi:hypothetical protein
MAQAGNPTAAGGDLAIPTGNPGQAVKADRIEPRRLIAFLAMVFGMFMAVLESPGYRLPISSRKW